VKISAGAACQRIGARIHIPFQLADARLKWETARFSLL
jgi:hypothetical protein